MAQVAPQVLPLEVSLQPQKKPGQTAGLSASAEIGGETPFQRELDASISSSEQTNPVTENAGAPLNTPATESGAAKQVLDIEGQLQGPLSVPVGIKAPSIDPNFPIDVAPEDVSAGAATLNTLPSSAEAPEIASPSETEIANPITQTRVASIGIPDDAINEAATGASENQQEQTPDLHLGTPNLANEGEAAAEALLQGGTDATQLIDVDLVNEPGANAQSTSDTMNAAAPILDASLALQTAAATTAEPAAGQAKDNIPTTPNLQPANGNPQAPEVAGANTPAASGSGTQTPVGVPGTTQQAQSTTAPVHPQPLEQVQTLPSGDRSTPDATRAGAPGDSPDSVAVKPETDTPKLSVTPQGSAVDTPAENPAENIDEVDAETRRVQSDAANRSEQNRPAQTHTTAQAQPVHAETLAAGSLPRQAQQSASAATPANGAGGPVSSALIDSENVELNARPQTGGAAQTKAEPGPASEQTRSPGTPGVQTTVQTAPAPVQSPLLDSIQPASIAPLPGEDGALPPLTLTQQGTSVSMRFGVSPQNGQPAHIPANSIAFQIARSFENGVNRFQIRIDPPELGRVDVRLEMSVDGRAQAHLTVERPETLDLMQRDARALERALSDAGLNTDKDSLSFSLKDQGQFAEQSSGGDTSASAIAAAGNEDAEIEQLHNSQRGYISETGVDISV